MRSLYKSILFFFITCVILFHVISVSAQYESHINADYIIENEISVSHILCEYSIMQNMFKLPSNNDLINKELNDTQNEVFDLSKVAIDVNFSQLGVDVSPSYNFSKFRLNLEIPYRFGVSEPFFGSFGDYCFSLSYNYKLKDIICNSSVGISLPTNNNNTLYDQIEISTGSKDFILNTSFYSINKKYGYYANVFFRYSGKNRQQYILDYAGTTHYELYDFVFHDGIYTAFSLNTYVKPFCNMTFHFGTILSFNSDGSHSYVMYKSWDNQRIQYSEESNENSFTHLGFKTSVCLNVKKIDFSANFFLIPFAYSYTNPISLEYPTLFMVSISRRFNL